MKKKIVSLCLVVALVAIMVVGGTLAYFTDTDDAINVMTSGKADIVQNEQQRAAEYIAKYDKYNPDGTPADDAKIVGYEVNYTHKDGDELVDFVDYKILVPAVYYTVDNEGNTSVKALDVTKPYTHPDKAGQTTVTGANGTEYLLFDKSVKNEVDKVITVTNKGTVPVYARTIVLFELGTGEFTAEELEAQYDLFDGSLNNFWYDKDSTVNGVYEKNTGVWNLSKDNIVEIDGVYYVYTTHYYMNELLPGQTSNPSLQQIMLDPTTTNEEAAKLMGDDYEYTILALSQAVQSDGFDDKYVALNSAFGEVTVDNVTEWFEQVVADQDKEEQFPAGHYANGEDNDAYDKAIGAEINP